MHIKVYKMHGLIHRVNIFDKETELNITEALIKCGHAHHVRERFTNQTLSKQRPNVPEAVILVNLMKTAPKCDIFRSQRAKWKQNALFPDCKGQSESKR